MVVILYIDRKKHCWSINKEITPDLSLYFPKSISHCSGRFHAGWSEPFFSAGVDFFARAMGSWISSFTMGNTSLTNFSSYYHISYTKRNLYFAFWLPYGIIFKLLHSRERACSLGHELYHNSPISRRPLHLIKGTSISIWSAELSSFFGLENIWALPTGQRPWIQSQLLWWCFEWSCSLPYRRWRFVTKPVRHPGRKFTR